MNIYEKVLAIQSEIKTVAKELSVGTGSSSYKAVSEASVLRAIKPLEEKYKVYSYAYDREIVSNETLTWMEDTWDYKAKKLVNKQKTKRIMTIKSYYRFVNVEKPDDLLETVTFGDGVDTGDKAPGKAMTYSDKYAPLKAYKMVTGDDPDEIHSDDIPQTPIKQKEMANTTTLNSIKEILGNDVDRTKKVLGYYGVKNIDDLDLMKAEDCLVQLRKKGEQ